MTYPGLPDGLIDWWVPGISPYSTPGTLVPLEDQVGVHPGASQIDGTSFNGSHVAIMESLDGTVDFGPPPWFCSLGPPLEIRPLPAINPDAGGDFRGSNPYTLEVTWGGSSPWWSSSSVTINAWLLALGGYGTSGAGGFMPTTTAFGDERSNGSTLVGMKFWSPDGVNMFFQAIGLPRQLWFGMAVDGGWHMFTITSDGTTISSYTDGVLVDQLLAPGWTDGDRGLHFGSRDASGPGDVAYASPWNGCIGDIQIWDVALFSGDVGQVFASGCFPNVARIRKRIAAVQ